MLCVIQFYNLGRLSGLMGLECFRLAAPFSIVATLFPILCVCLLNSIHYSILQLSRECHLRIQHRFAVV